MHETTEILQQCKLRQENRETEKQVIVLQFTTSLYMRINHAMKNKTLERLYLSVLIISDTETSGGSQKRETIRIY